MLLKGKVALVTGASQGIGLVTAKILAKEGANLVLNYIGDSDLGKKIEDEIKAQGVDAIAIMGDVSNFGEMSSMMEKVKDKFGKIDILVNNAGITKDRTVKNMTKEEWDAVININLTGVFNVTKNAIPLLNERGRIISISSVSGLCGNFGQGNYAASKAGIVGFTKTLAKELGKKKITVNAIAPGFIDTPMTKNLPFIRKKMILMLIPLKEFGQPQDVADAIVFLASDKAKYITGEVISVGGGLNF